MAVAILSRLRTPAGRPPRTAGLWWLLLPLLALARAEPAPPTDPAAIVAAVRLAYGLERAYWNNPRAWPTWAQLYQHYRQGFSNELARAMTDFTRSGSGDLATWQPDQVHVAHIDGDSAIAWFPVPPEFQDPAGWGFAPYMVVRLRREPEGRWVIDWGTDSAAPP